MAEALRRLFPRPPGPGPVGIWVRGPVLERANGLLRELGGPPLRALELSWRLRGRNAGEARLLAPGRGLLRLNRQLFEFPEDDYLELRDTVLHELAHLVVFSRWPRAAPHGCRWQSVAERLGARPRATHALPLARARTRTEHAYRLAAGVVWLGAVRHARLQRGAANYRVRLGGRCWTIRAGDYTGETRTLG